MSGISKSIGESPTCVVCDQQTGLKIEGAADDDVHLCRECWDNRNDGERVLIELSERGVLAPESVALVLQEFYDQTVKCDYHPEFVGVQPDIVIPTAVRRGQPTTLAQLADVAGSNDGYCPYNGVWWDAENGDTSVFAVAGVYSLEGDFPALGATLYVGETMEVLEQLLDENPVGSSRGGA